MLDDGGCSKLFFEVDGKLAENKPLYCARVTRVSLLFSLVTISRLNLKSIDYTANSIIDVLI